MDNATNRKLQRVGKTYVRQSNENKTEPETNGSNRIEPNKRMKTDHTRLAGDDISKIYGLSHSTSWSNFQQILETGKLKSMEGIYNELLQQHLNKGVFFTSSVFMQSI